MPGKTQNSWVRHEGFPPPSTTDRVGSMLPPMSLAPQLPGEQGRAGHVDASHTVGLCHFRGTQTSGNHLPYRGLLANLPSLCHPGQKTHPSSILQGCCFYPSRLFALQTSLKRQLGTKTVTRHIVKPPNRN